MRVSLIAAALLCVSDYLSFAGRDERGLLLFALDTNRGRAGGEYQAEHFVVLYDQPVGWVDVEGYDEFPNPERRLLELPESPYFDFAGEPFGGLTVASKTADLELEVEPLVPRTTVQDERTLFSMASAAATLVLDGRRVRGRVIYELLVMAGANRLAGVSLEGVWRMLTGPSGFQGLYLASAEGEDFYVHQTASGAAAAAAPLLAFMASGARTEAMEDLRFEVTDHAFAPGFYRWPRAWEVRWRGAAGPAVLTVEAISHATQKSWLLGGFAMQAVQGTLRYGGRETVFFGFGELIR